MSSGEQHTPEQMAELSRLLHESNKAIEKLDWPWRTKDAPCQTCMGRGRVGTRMCHTCDGKGEL